MRRKLNLIQSIGIIKCRNTKYFTFTLFLLCMSWELPETVKYSQER